jgi:hypothetical protein
MSRIMWLCVVANPSIEPEDPRDAIVEHGRRATSSPAQLTPVEPSAGWRSRASHIGTGVQATPAGRGRHLSLVR